MNTSLRLGLPALLLFACASQGPKPRYVEEKNQARFAVARSFSEKPDQVLRAARAALDRLNREGLPPTEKKITGETPTLYTGWVYNQASRDKYVQYDSNGAMQRKTLPLRRIYGYTVTPSLAGSQVSFNVEEEVQMVDLKTGEPGDWKKVEPEAAAYELLKQRLQEQLRAE